MEQLSRRCKHCGKLYAVKNGHTCNPSEIKQLQDESRWINSFLMVIAKGLIHSRDMTTKTGKVYIQGVNWIKRQDKDKK